MFCAGGYTLYLPCSHLSPCGLLFYFSLPFPQPELEFLSKYFIRAYKRGSSSRLLVSVLLSTQIVLHCLHLPWVLILLPHYYWGKATNAKARNYIGEVYFYFIFCCFFFPLKSRREQNFKSLEDSQIVVKGAGTRTSWILPCILRLIILLSEVKLIVHFLS